MCWSDRHSFNGLLFIRSTLCSLAFSFSSTFKNTAYLKLSDQHGQMIDPIMHHGIPTMQFCDQWSREGQQSTVDWSLIHPWSTVECWSLICPWSTVDCSSLINAPWSTVNCWFSILPPMVRWSTLSEQKLVSILVCLASQRTFPLGKSNNRKFCHLNTCRTLVHIHCNFCIYVYYL